MNALFSPDTVSPWLVAYTEPRAEKRVKTGIEDIRHEVFCPAEKLMIVHRGRRVETERPLFSRYVFFRPQRGQWGNVLGVDGVTDVLRNNDMASMVSATWIDALRKAEAYGVFDRTQNGTEPFTTGELVRVSAGPFSGHNVVIELIHKLKSSTAKKRAKVLLDFMGRQSKFDIDVCELEKL